MPTPGRTSQLFSCGKAYLSVLREDNGESKVGSDFELLLKAIDTKANSLYDDVHTPFLTISHSAIFELGPQAVHKS